MRVTWKGILRVGSQTSLTEEALRVEISHRDTWAKDHVG